MSSSLPEKNYQEIMHTLITHIKLLILIMYTYTWTWMPCCALRSSCLVVMSPLRSGSYRPSDCFTRATLWVRLSCLSVCLSHAGIVSKTKKASIMISSPSGSPTILVFWCQISFRHSNGFPRTRASNKVGGGKIQPISSCKYRYLENGSR